MLTTWTECTTEILVRIPFDDAMGYPGFKQRNDNEKNRGLSDYNSDFFRHYTVDKQLVNEAGEEVVMQALAEALQKNLSDHDFASERGEGSHFIHLGNSGYGIGWVRVSL